MKKAISVKPIGVIRTPYKEPKGMPIQGKFEKGIKGTIRLFSEYRAGLKDIEGFSHLILIYHFNRSKEERLTGKPFLEDTEHGIFAIRSPHRPNHLGFSIVKFEKRQRQNYHVLRSRHFGRHSAFGHQTLRQTLRQPREG